MGEGRRMVVNQEHGAAVVCEVHSQNPFDVAHDADFYAQVIDIFLQEQHVKTAKREAENKTRQGTQYQMIPNLKNIRSKVGYP